MKINFLRFFKIFLLGGFQLFFQNQVQAKLNYDAISKCFWVYAPIHEVAKELRLNELQFFTQGRVGWYAGFFQANKENSEFNVAFKYDLESRKSVGLAMGDELRRAIKNNNNETYLRVINKAVECDSVIGVRTEYIPKLGR